MMFKLRTSPLLLEAHVSTGRAWELSTKKKKHFQFLSDFKLTASMTICDKYYIGVSLKLITLFILFGQFIDYQANRLF